VTIRVGVNGFGRIGRNFYRALAAQKAEGKSTDIEVLAVNDLTDNASLAHLLKFDSILGRYPEDVSLEGEDTIVIGAAKVKALEVKEGPAALPWGIWGWTWWWSPPGFSPPGPRPRVIWTRGQEGHHLRAGQR
jgi:glyceraldehyde 3-phosphate dehydrogenase